MHLTKRQAIRGAVLGLGLLTTRGSAQVGDQAGGLRRFTPEMFGAVGDGRTNDSAAFGALAQAVEAAGGGRIVLRRTTYRVGAQQPVRTPVDGYGLVPAKLLHLAGCSGPIVIEGNGATLKCAPGLRYGTFDPATGQPIRRAMPNLAKGDLATPYTSMISITDCTGPVAISDLELDGSLPDLEIGGQYGDTGWQIPAIGIFLARNRGDEVLSGLRLHHHAQDGLMINGLGDAALARRVRRHVRTVRCEYNGRQGCSLIGGRGYVFERCSFSHTGRAGLMSAPAAGLDIEAEGDPNRDHRFLGCEFVDNGGCGMVADSGDSADVSFRGCRFVGTTNWSAWPSKPGFRFEDCTFAGSVVRCFGDPDPARATQFHRCVLTDDPALSPTGRIFRGGKPDGPLADLSDSQNVLFADTSLLADHGAVLPWSTRAIYRNCVMRQKAASPGYPRGLYEGRNQVTGAVDLYSSRVDGELVLNGKRLTSLTW